ncbi:MAG TPA: S9 family peptidase, partial [Thermomicrobiales bacterium]|nr:S9 family peptidase [Thermomicrobiales bacterium]
VDRETGKSESQIWVCNIDGTERRRLTWIGTRNADPVWSPDGSQLAYVAARDGDHPYAIVILGFDGGDSRVLTRHASSPSSLAWSPDGSTIAYTKAVDPDNPEETPRDPKATPAVRLVKRMDFRQDGLGFINNIRSQIFLLDVATSERHQLTHTPVDHTRPTWSPDGKALAIGLPNRNGLRGQIGILDVASGDLRASTPYDGAVALFAWSPDGTRLLFDGAYPYSPHHDYSLVDVATATVTPVTTDVHFLPDVGYQSGGNAGAPVWLDEKTALVHGLSKGRSGIWKLDLATGNTTEVAIWNEMHSSFAVSADNSTVVQAVSSIDGVIGLMKLDVASGESSLLFNEAADVFAATPLAAWELVSIERAGFTVEGWLLKPANFDERKTYPIILDVHGGPHNAYGYGINALAEMYASNGYFVLLPNPRGSGTYSRAFAEAVIGDWGGGDWADLEAILDHVLERPYIDSDRTGIYGYSYGGYMTAWVLGHTDRFRTIICGAPVFDFESTFGQSDIGHVRATGEPPWEAREYLTDRSPATHIQNAVTPTLIIQGEADERCPVEQSEQLFMSLMMLGVETEFIRYPGQSHLFINSGDPAYRLDFFARTLAWFNRFLEEDR